MSDESDLNTYNLQLQQVEAALTTDPENEELLQLKQDLEQVIKLTSELISGTNDDSRGETQDEELEAAYEEKKKKKSSRWGEKAPVLPVRPWQVGENCQAIYPEDGQYYNAVIQEINSDEVVIKFQGYQKEFTTTLSTLQMPVNRTTTDHSQKNRSKREMEQKRKEYLKEKKKKKLEKMKDLQEAKEKEKGKWLNFSSKAFGKKGFVKKSIFKTPESSDGKVGVGTCGVSGQGMTDFTQAKKFRNMI